MVLYNNCKNIFNEIINNPNKFRRKFVVSEIKVLTNKIDILHL